MEQRRVRLGDILDDYCTRERRLTNHAVVAMIDDQIKQTRCTTCDTEHPYKGAKVPSRRKKVEGSVARRPVVAPAPAAVLPDDDVAAPMAPPGIVRPARVAEVAPPLEVAPPPPPEPVAPGPDTSAANPDDEPAVPGIEEGPVHRRLIRATLPRPEGHVPERKIPEFTIREAAARGKDRHARGQAGRPGGKFARPQGQSGRPGKHRPPRPGQGAAHGAHPAQKPAGGHGQRAHRSRGRGKKSGH